MRHPDRFHLDLNRADMGGTEDYPHSVVVILCEGCGALVVEELADRHPHPLTKEDPTDECLCDPNKRMYCHSTKCHGGSALEEDGR